MEQCDGLFVINQDTSLEEINTFCHTKGFSSVLVLTTHRLFSSELEVWPKAKVLSFSDLLSEEDMCNCDKTAESKLLIEQRAGPVGYNARFMELSLIEKNRIIYERLSTLYHFQFVYYTSGLGISSSYWDTIGLPLHNLEQNSETEYGIKKILSKMLKNLFYAKKAVKRLLRPDAREVNIIREDGIRYVFFSPLKRLNLRPDQRTETAKFPQDFPKTLLESPKIQPPANLKHSASGSIKHWPGNKNIYCMTHHGYNQTLAKQLGGVMVFVDGYHPSNYPRSYLNNYGNDDTFVVRTMFDDRWFTTNGKRTIKPPAFLQREYFAPCAASSVSRILVALNHAGDWTSLINRSDTDDLVVATIKMARSLPQIKFRVRIHPTMDHPAHEGLYSSKRIESFIQWSHLPNLHTSTESLEKDLEWCHLCISEYSQVLLDTFRIGKPGVALNLTKRRSFMQDYADIGFFHTSSAEETLVLLKYIIDNPIRASNQQNEAVNHYNSLLAEWLGEPLLR